MLKDAIRDRDMSRLVDAFYAVVAMHYQSGRRIWMAVRSIFFFFCFSRRIIPALHPRRGAGRPVFDDGGIVCSVDGHCIHNTGAVCPGNVLRWEGRSWPP